MRRLVLFILFTFVIASATPASAKQHPYGVAADKCDDKTCPMPKAVSSPAFDLIKSLSGTWKGTWIEGNHKEPMQVKYRVTSGGTAVEEIIFPNTPKEMVSMYTVQGGKVHMTHYCMMGNQPQMIESSASSNELSLKLTKTPGINPKKDTYMAGFTLIKKDDHHIIYKGSGFKDGKPMKCPETALTR